MDALYREDLAYIHHAGFGAFAAGAAPGLLAMLHAAGIDEGLVVDLGCGSGLWAAALLRAGYDVLGVDASPAMLALARRVAPGARFIEASLHDVVLPPCRAVTVLGEGLNYATPEGAYAGDLPAFFTRVADALAPGGLLIFDVVMRAKGRPMCYQAQRAGPDWRVTVAVDEDPARSLLTRRITTWRWVAGAERQAEETHVVRTFTRAEVEQALRACGFSVRVHRRYGALPLPPQRLAFRARLHA